MTTVKIVMGADQYPGVRQRGGHVHRTPGRGSGFTWTIEAFERRYARLLAFRSGTTLSPRALAMAS